MDRGYQLGLVISRSRVRLLVPAPYAIPKEAHRKVGLFCFRGLEKTEEHHMVTLLNRSKVLNAQLAQCRCCQKP